jgi:hypothetical protein
MRLKRWESPRREGRNDKGRGGSARARQLKKQAQALRKKLKEDDTENSKNNRNKGGKENKNPFLFCLGRDVLWNVSTQKITDFLLQPVSKNLTQERDR